MGGIQCLFQTGYIKVLLMVVVRPGGIRTVIPVTGKSFRAALLTAGRVLHHIVGG